MIENLSLKVCKKCGEGKPLTEYRITKNGKYSYPRTICKSCDKKDYSLWYQKNKVRRYKYKQQDWYKKYSRDYAKIYRDSHKKERTFWQRRRVCRKLNNGGSMKFSEWEGLKVLFNNTCLCCGKSEPQIKLVPDHIVPLKFGGRDSIENIQPLCKECNGKKHIKTIDYRKVLLG